MNRGRAGAVLACGALLACAAIAAPGLAADRRPPMRFASPAKAIAAEIALAQLAQRKGQWTALRDTAAQDAVMFVPQAVTARDWLKGRKNPAASVTWQPHQTWLSCDGSVAVNYGPWRQADGSQGYFTTVWQRQRDGEYKWTMAQGDALPVALDTPEMIGSSVATCDRRAGPPSGSAPTGPTAMPVPAPPGLLVGTRGGWSDDKTLSWAVVVDVNCGRALTVSLYRGAARPMEPVLQKRVAAPAPGAGQPAATCPVA